MSDSYSSALDAAKAELASIESMLTKLIPRKAVLETLVQQLGTVIGGQAAPILSIPEQDTEPGEYLWQQIANAMRDAGNFTLAQAGIAVEAMTGTSLGPNRPQKVRNSVIRHPETFERHIDGTYTVRGGN